MRRSAGRAAKSIRSARTRPWPPKWSIFASAWMALPHAKVACMRVSASSAVGGDDAGAAMCTAHPERPRRQARARERRGIGPEGTLPALPEHARAGHLVEGHAFGVDGVELGVPALPAHVGLELAHLDVLPVVVLNVERERADQV